MAGGERRRTASAVANDEVIRRAIVDEIAANGVDRFGPTGVARRAGLTTGAVYSRYESVPEMAVDVWLSGVGAAHQAFLESLLVAFEDGDASQLTPVIDELLDPSPDTIVAVELLVATHRVDELEEVVGEDVRRWFAAWGAGPGDDPGRQAEVAFGLAVAWGILLYSLAGVTGSRGEWDRGLRWLQRAQTSGFEPEGALTPLDDLPLTINTGDQVRDRLLTATMEVTARVGMANATASRIARRAGTSPATIYAGFASKDDLVVETIRVVLDEVLPEAERALLASSSSMDPLERVAQSLECYLRPNRRPWRLVRIEAHLNARHLPEAPPALRAVLGGTLETYPTATGIDLALREVVAPLLRMFASVVLGLGLIDALDLKVNGADWRVPIYPLGGSGAPRG
jgi:AcrR family transcriptional regulator